MTIETAWLVNIALAVLALQAAWHASDVARRRSAPWLHWLAGLSLLAAWRIDLAGLAWPWAASLLAIAGLAHVAASQKGRQRRPF